MRGVRREGKEMTMRRGKRYRRAVSARVRYRVGTRTFASRPDNGRRRPFLELEGEALQSFRVGLSTIAKSHVVEFDHHVTMQAWTSSCWDTLRVERVAMARTRLRVADADAAWGQK
mmetsp:Transcript_19408/g.31423  ORF Transcript_19408/g.31423 Transcript_19408/m.31423 type:complete len:116 (+) Transcript_19408:763-1110(+)